MTLVNKTRSVKFNKKITETAIKVHFLWNGDSRRCSFWTVAVTSGSKASVYVDLNDLLEFVSILATGLSQFSKVPGQLYLAASQWSKDRCGSVGEKYSIKKYCLVLDFYVINSSVRLKGKWSVCTVKSQRLWFSLYGFKASFNRSVTAVSLLLPVKNFHGFSKVSVHVESSVYAGSADVLIYMIHHYSDWVRLFFLSCFGSFSVQLKLRSILATSLQLTK